MRWSDLTSEQQRLLAAWFILADASVPEADEELPLEAAQALYFLAIATGKRGKFDTSVPQVHKPVVPTLPNHKRSIVVRRGEGALAS